MTQKHKKRRKNAMLRGKAQTGAPPGTLTVNPSAQQSCISVFAFSKDKVFESKDAKIDDLKKIVDQYDSTWINIDGLADIEMIQNLGSLFGLHKLALEDTVNVHQRPKVEPYPNHLYIVCRTVTLHAHCESEQLSLFLGKKFVISFQEIPGDCFDSVRERIRSGRGKIREAPVDYLCYALLDAIIDSYFPILESCGERAEILEDRTLSAKDPQGVVTHINSLKRDLLAVRRAIWPLRESVNVLLRETSPWISDETKFYLRDCYDHCVQIIDTVENLRELGAGLMDVALSSMNHRLNETMRVLTVISTIFIPLNFIASIYGMNFDTARSPWNMPELEWTYGYPFALSLMCLVALAQYMFFYYRGWMNPPEHRDIHPENGKLIDHESQSKKIA